jgi:gliding motility-associated protein GldM
MAGYKETPRQKMIGMLYLVLTALLALNVSKDILDAFLVVNESMVSTNESFSSKIATEYARFENQYNLNPGKVEEFWEKAKEVRQKSEDLIAYIEKVQLEVVTRSEKKSQEEVLSLYYRTGEVPDLRNPGQTKERSFLILSEVPSRDKYDEATNYMIGQNKNGEAYTLAAKMQEYRSFILDIIGQEYADKIGLNTQNTYKDATNTTQDWQYYNFFHTILAANVTILNKIVTEIQSAEFDAINKLYENISEKDFKFDNVSAKVIPSSTYILAGQNYEAEVLVAAFDSKTQSEVRVLRGADRINESNIGNTQVIKSQNGVVKLTFPGQSIGPQRYAGIIEMRDPVTQELAKYPFSADYIVAPPSLTVAPLKMNILYSGLKNPLAISSPGIPSEQISPSITKGKITKGANGTWEVEVPSGERTTTISAAALVDGKSLPLGSFEFRIKRVPDPIAKIADLTDGTIDKNRLLASRAIIPEMIDFDFEGFHFEIVSYELTTYRGSELQRTGTVKGNQFTEAVTNLIKGAGRGQRLYFERIQAKGPDGTMRTLNPINLEIN